MAPRSCSGAAVIAFLLLAGAAAAVKGSTPPTATWSKPGSAASSRAATATRSKPATTPKPTAPRKIPPARRAPAASSLRTPLESAAEARAFAEAGAYGRAVDDLRALRRRVAPDADLEIALALYEARTGAIDSAAARLATPLLEKALVDTLPIDRRHTSVWKPEALWINGRFDGWPWYVARARAEIAAQIGRWSDALEAERLAVAARPLYGKEWLFLSLAAARTGATAEAEAAADHALRLDPALPEAQYLAGLFAWRAGRRAEAHARFRSAVALDSTYREPAFALVRSRLPGVAPDTLPASFLNGIREVGLVTSPVRPKIEEFQQVDAGAVILNEAHVVVPDSLKSGFQKSTLYVGVLIDARGRIVATDLPWFDPRRLPEPVVGLVMQDLTRWRFQPATRNGAPHAVWTNVELTIEP
jgi:tetratricopeptide (TPR) repeat protein